MHYYKRNIGDYAKKAGRLSMLQHGAYTLLLDACYDREAFPTRDQALEWAWASTPEEINAVDFVLSRFFVKEADGTFTQLRVLQELLDYAKFCDLQADKGKKGGRPRKPNGFSDKPNGNPTETQRKAEESLTTNHKPLTTNQEPDIAPARQSKKITLGKYLEQCKQSGVKAIPADHALFNYCEKQSLPEEFVFICWKRFVDYYRDGAGSKKLYTDWPGTFLNNVKNNYYKLWYLDDAGRYALTTAGKQAQREFGENA